MNGVGAGAKAGAAETPELRRLRRQIDALDRRIVSLLNERARLGLATCEAKAAAGWQGIRDPDREREVLEQVAEANEGPFPRDDLLALYRRLMATVRRLEAEERRRRAREGRPERSPG